jgi:hypothetical protein
MCLFQTGGTSDAIVALTSAVERGRRHGLALHESPRVVAHFQRCERLLREIVGIVELLRQGLTNQNRRILKAGIEKAGKIGLSCSEVKEAKRKLGIDVREK